jgi:SAM-dependent methyltransferase
MGSGFGGEVATFYQRYRRGYPAAVFDAIAAEFDLTSADTAVDLGCGTGQLALPLASRLRAVVGLDPEPDMLRLARAAAADRGLANLSWLLAADTDVPALTALLGRSTVGAATIGQALHWMDHESLFTHLRTLLRSGGGIAVVTNGTPLWLQDTAWSRALRGILERQLGKPLTQACGTDEPAQLRYQAALRAAGYEVRRQSIDYSAALTFDQLLGGVYSAMRLADLSTNRRTFAAQVRQAVDPDNDLTEHVRVQLLTGRHR